MIVATDSQRPVEHESLLRMRDMIAHRGPDDVGTWISDDKRVGLAHRRLSIVDLSPRAAQPMALADGSLRIVFNGEIYNHAELRRELEARGCGPWQTDHSDTEVILHAFAAWGIDCLKRFRGMFAFALWDERNSELWLVRDRLGVKPLYYTQNQGRLLFASEIKALLTDPDVPRAVNELAFYHFLSFLTTPAPDTLFTGIRKLPPATWLRIHRDGRIQEQTYWDVWSEVQPLTGISEADAAAMILDELQTAVRLRSVSDVPVGVFLSGGIDSSTNAALLSKCSGQRVRTFSVGYDREYGSNPSELGYARLMADRLGAEYHERIISMQDTLDFIPSMVHLQDEPIADPVCIPVYFLSQLARESGVMVCQVGEGADELFCGYPGWQQSLKLQRIEAWPLPRLSKKLTQRALAASGRRYSFAYEWLRRGLADQPVFWGGAEAFTHVHKAALLSPRLRREFASYSSWEALNPIRRRFEETAWDRTDLNWMSYLDLKFRLPELLLMRVDKMSMGASIECRVPFLDHKFVELAMSIPAGMKTANGELKHLLKRAVRGVIPDEIIDRPKQGFGVPIYEWFFSQLGDYARSVLTEFCRKTDFLDAGAVSRLLASRRPAQTWYLLNFALWWSAYIDPDGVSAPLPTGCREADLRRSVEAI